jgi:hypothetical protein
VKNTLLLIPLLALAFSAAAQTSFALDNICPPKSDQANVNCPECAAKAAAGGVSGIDQLASDVNSLSCEPWAVTRSFDSINQCPKLFFDQIFKDRVSELYFKKSPKVACPISGSTSLPDAESLEAVLASNPVTALGIPPGSITSPKCLYKNYRGTNLDTIFGRLWPSGTATEPERMTAVAEYYYHMNKIKYAEQGLLSQMAGIDSILGGEILPDKNCVDPYNPFSAKWCEAYHSNSCQGSGKVAAVAAVLKKKYDQLQPLEAQLAAIPSKSQPEQKPLVQAKQNAINAVIGDDAIMRSTKFQEVVQKTGGDTDAALRAQLQENRANLASQLEKLQEASRCINSSQSVRCPTLESTVNKVPDDFLPEMTGKGGDVDKTNIAQAYMDRVSCYQGQRGGKDAWQKSEMHLAFTGASLAIGAGEALVADALWVNADKAAWVTAFRVATVAWGLASAVPIARDTLQTCIDASHHMTGNLVSGDDPYQVPSCSKYPNPGAILAVHNYTACKMGLGKTAITALLPTLASTKAGAWILSKGKIVGLGGGGLVKQVFTYGVGSTFVTSFLGVTLNPGAQQASKMGAQLLSDPATVLSNWLSQPNTQQRKSSRHSIDQLNSSLDPSKYAGLSPDEASKLFQATATNAYKILLNNQQVLRGDQLNGLSLKWNQRLQPSVFYAQMDTAHTLYYAARTDIGLLDTYTPKLTDAEKKARIVQDQASMKEAEAHMARNIAAKILYDFMTPQYRTGKELSDPDMRNGLSLIYDANQTGMLTSIMKQDIAELLSMDGWSQEQVDQVIKAQINGQNQNNSP